MSIKAGDLKRKQLGSVSFRWSLDLCRILRHRQCQGMIFFPDFSIWKGKTNSLRYQTILLMYYLLELHIGLMLPQKYLLLLF